MASTAGEAFWTWVLDHEPRLRAAIVAMKGGHQDPVLDDLLEQLHLVDPDLYVLMGGQPDGTLELIITAEGKLTAFPSVAAVVNEAPPLKGWQVIAFKPPMGGEFVLNHEGARIDVMKTAFLPLSSPSGGFGVRLGCATYDPRWIRPTGSPPSRFSTYFWVSWLLLATCSTSRSTHYPPHTRRTGICPLRSCLTISPGEVRVRGAELS